MTIERAAALFRILANETRLRILQAVSRRGGASVQRIATQAGVSQSAVSHQLRTLLADGVVASKKEGRVVTYTLGRSAAARRAASLLRFVK